MIKFRWYYDKDKEEIFLNEMVSKGYAMKKFFLGFYSFEDCVPNEYTYRIDLLNGKSYEEKSDYIQLVKESGGEFVQKWGPWVFFRRTGEFELYTDNESQIQFYSRIKKFFLFFAILELVVMMYELLMYVTLERREMELKYLFLSFVILLFLLSIIFFYQVSKCNKKIESFKEEI